MFFSLTEVSSKGSQLSSKRGVHRNTHKAWTGAMFDRPPIAFATFHFALKIRVWQKTLLPYTEANICNGKTKGLALLSLNRLIKANQRIEPMNRSNESNQWIESVNRINESNQWIEAMNRTNESIQRIEAMNRTNESNQWIEPMNKKPSLLGSFAGIFFPHPLCEVLFILLFTRSFLLLPLLLSSSARPWRPFRARVYYIGP